MSVVKDVILSHQRRKNICVGVSLCGQQLFLLYFEGLLHFLLLYCPL